MSWKASAHVLDLANHRRDLSPTEVLVLLALAARHNDRDYHCAFGQLNKVVEDTHLHLVTISQTISGLADKGVISIWEGQLPRRKGDSSDRRKTRGTMWCFVGLDPDDGPDIEDCVRRRQGRDNHVDVAPEKSFSPGLSESEADRLAGNGGLFSRQGADRLAGGEGIASPEMADRLAGSISPLTTGFNRPVSSRPQPIETGPPGPPQGEDGAVRSAEPADSLESIAHGPPLRDGHCPLCGNVINTRGEGHRNWRKTCPAFGLTIDQVDEAIAAARAAEPPADHHAVDTDPDES